jgi:NAD+ synthase (glutamine-hydrolysing)
VGRAAYEPLEEIAAVHDALLLGVGDYLRKCGFTKAVIGLSGGIDSAVTCALAARALDPENVLGVTMPSMYSSEGSVTDSQRWRRTSASA